MFEEGKDVRATQLTGESLLREELVSLTSIVSFLESGKSVRLVSVIASAHAVTTLLSMFVEEGGILCDLLLSPALLDVSEVTWAVDLGCRCDIVSDNVCSSRGLQLIVFACKVCCRL